MSAGEPITVRTWEEDGSWHMTTSMVVAVPPESAFDYVADVTRHPEWAANPMQVFPLVPGPVGVGSRYRTVARQLGREWESEVEVTAYERPHHFEFAAVGGSTHEPADHPHHHHFTFTPVPGGTSIELHRQARGTGQRPWSQRALMPLIVRFSDRVRARTFANLRRCLEQHAVAAAAREAAPPAGQAE